MYKKRILITGGSRGIGKAIADIYRSAEYEVVTPNRSDMDLADEKSIQNFFSDHNKFGFDILINNAAENIIANLNDLSLEKWKRMQCINLSAPFLLTQFASRHMIANQWGRIVNISSAYSNLSRVGRGGYGATKAGINSLTRTAALEYASHNILVNAVAPGFVETDLTKQNNSEEQIDALKQQIPLKRLANPQEIAELVYFLGSEQNTYITGQTIYIDGGFTSQ